MRLGSEVTFAKVTQLESVELGFSSGSSWIAENVLIHLPAERCHEETAQELLQHLSQDFAEEVFKYQLEFAEQGRCREGTFKAKGIHTITS